MAIPRTSLPNLRIQKGLLTRLASPASAKSIGTSIGQAMLGPQNRKERRDREAFSKELLTAAGDPTKIGNILTTYGAKLDDPELAMRGAGMLSTAMEAKRIQDGQSALAYIQDQMRQTLQTELTENFTAQDQQQRLNDLQLSANAVARNVRGLDPLAVAGMSMNMENAVFQQQSARNQDRRAEEALEIRFEGHEMALAKHKEYMETRDYRDQMRGFERNEALHNAAIKSAQQSGGTDEDRAKFLQLFPDMEGIWETVTTQKESQNLQLKKLKADAKSNKFDYKNEQLFDLLGIPEDERTEETEQGKKNLKAIERLRVLPPKKAYEVLQAAVESSFAKAKAPPAALVGLFKDAAMAYTAGQGPFVSDEKEEGEAAQLALIGAQAYMEAGSGIDAFKSATEAMAKASKAVKEGKKEGENELIERLKQLDMATEYPD